MTTTTTTTTSDSIVPRPVIPLEDATVTTAAEEWGRFFVYLALQLAQRVMAVVVIALAARVVLGVVGKDTGFTPWVLPGAGSAAAVAALIGVTLALIPTVAVDQRTEGRRLAVAGTVMVAICAGWFAIGG